MLGSAFFAAALATAAGVSAQVLAAHLAIPSVVVLLAAGILLGPDGLGWLDPAAFGSARGDLVSLAVTVILFEGGLGLDLDRLREQWRALGRLLGAGVALSMLVGTFAARWLLGASWEIAVLYGALMTVTGPTVVTPLVARLPLARATRELLVGEGVLIDPVGAIIALVVADALLGHSDAVESSYLVLVRLGTGAFVGITLGMAVSALCRRQLVPEHLGLAAVDDQVLLQRALAGGGLDPRADRRLAHRQHLRLDAERSRDLRLGVGQPAALLEELAPVEAGGEVAVGEAEPARRAELGQAVEDREAVVAQAPAALLVDLAAEPVGDQVGVGGDVDAEDLDVVAGVGDHAQVGADLLLHAGGELGAAGAAGEECDTHPLRPPIALRSLREEPEMHACSLRAHAQWSPSGRPVSLIPACAL